LSFIDDQMLYADEIVTNIRIIQHKAVRGIDVVFIASRKTGILRKS